MSLFPMYVQARGEQGGEVIVHAAFFCCDAFPPFVRQLAVVLGRPGPLRPDLVLVPGDDHQVEAWLSHLTQGAALEPAAARRIVEAANQVEARFMTVMRERHALNYAESQR